MRLVVQLIYYYPVTPRCDVINMEDDLFGEFLKGDDEKRKKIVCEALQYEYSHKVKAVTWFPLDGQEKVCLYTEQDDYCDNPVRIVVPAHHIRIVFKLRYRDERDSQVETLILEPEEWRTFFHGDARVRVHVVCKRLGCDDKSDEVKEVAWFIDGCSKLFLKGEQCIFEGD